MTEDGVTGLLYWKIGSNKKIRKIKKSLQKLNKNQDTNNVYIQFIFQFYANLSIDIQFVKESLIFAQKP